MNRVFLASIFIFLCLDANAMCYESFEMLLDGITTEDSILAENTDGYYIEELMLSEDGELIDKRKLNSVPETYTYYGRLFPSKSQLKIHGINVYVRRVVMKDIRVVTERTSDGSEPSSYWFRRLNGCWKLTSRAVNVRE